MRGAKRRLPLVALALLAIALTPTERAQAQSVPRVTWAVNNFAVFEPQVANILIFATVDIPAGPGLDVNYTIGGTATCGTDYTIPGANCSAMTGTFTIPAGTPRFDLVRVPVTVLEDAVSDNAETITLNITDGADYDLGTTPNTTITIYEQTGRSAFRISGRPQVNGVLTGNRVCADADGEGTLAYQWQRSTDIAGGRWLDISGATSQSYTLQQSNSGEFFRLRVQHTDGKGFVDDVYSPMVGPIGPVAVADTVKFSRDSYNVREGEPLRPTLNFSSPTKREHTFEIVFHACDAELLEDIEADAYTENRDRGATHRVTVPAGVMSHTFSLPVLLDDEIEGYESFVMGFQSVPSGFSIGSQNDAMNRGSYAQVQIVDVNFVPENWTLKPGAINAGDQFRLLFKTENERNATSGNIADYDTFVRNRISSSTHGHADIRQYAPTFRVVGSTNTVDAAWHTATGIMVNGEPSHTPFSHQINWLNGPKIADDYNDFWDGTWDNNAQTGANQRNALGVATTSKRGPNTGTQTGTTHATAGVKYANKYLGHSSQARWGGTQQSHNPLSQGNIGVSSSNVYIGLSGIFLPLDVSAANPLVTIEARQSQVEEGTAITYTLRAFPAPSSPVTVNVKVAETTAGGQSFLEAAYLGSNPTGIDSMDRTIPTSGVATFTVKTHDDGVGEPDGEVTVSIGAGTGYRTLAAYDTVMTTVISEDDANTLSVSVALGDGTNGPAQTGANLDFTFSVALPRETSELRGISTQLAWSGDVLSPRSDHRPATWDRYKINPKWKPDGSAKVNRRGAYVRPWLENSILIGQQSFDLRVHVKNRAEAGGNVGDGWIAMRALPGPGYIVESSAEWACMPVGGGTCPSAWPGVPTASVDALDNGSVMSGNDARFRVYITPPPPAGQTRRVYLKTWEVFINAIDEIPNWWDDHCQLPDGLTSADFNPDKHCDPPPRRGDRKVQFEAYTHVDVGSGGSAVFTMPTKIWRSTENMTGREYWAEVQQDVAYSVAHALRQDEVTTTIFDPAAAACWYGHRHQSARLITVDGEQVYAPAGMGITECRTAEEIEEDDFGITVWTSCKPDYGHRSHPHTGNGSSHQHHNHNPPTKVGNGSCPGGQPQTDGGGSQDGQTGDPPGDPFPDPGALGFSNVTASGMTLSWPEREVDHYLVYWAENVANADAQSAQVDAGTLTYTITGLKPGTEYAVIVYSQDYDEVTPTGYQRTAAGSTIDTTPQLPDYSELKATVRGYADETQHGQAHVDRWKRALAGLGDEDALAEGYTPMTAAEAQDMADTYTASRWDPIVEALTELESREATEPEPDPIPELSLSGGGGVNEGGSASFTIHADPAPAADVTVSVAVAQSGDYLDAPGAGTRAITLAAGATTASLTVATVNDGTDEADGSVSVSLNAGTGYTVASSNAAATVAVRDDDDPPPASSCVSGTQWRTVEGYYKSNAGKAPNYGANWYRVLIAYRSEHADRALPDWTGPTAEPTAAFTVKEAEDGEKAWGGWTPVREALECLRDAGRISRSFAPLVPAASTPAREGVVRIANTGARGGSVRIAATDDAGWRPEPLQLHLGAGQSVDLTSADLERGSPSKGLSGGTGTGTGDWRLDVSGEGAVEVRPRIRSADGRLAAMGAVAPVRDGAHQVAVLHPADGAQRTGLLRLVNRESRTLGVRITALDDGGAPGGAVSLALPARAAATYTALELERGGAGLDGALGDGHGLWRLRVASTGELAVMALAEEPGGHLANLSDPAAALRLESGVHAVAGFPSAYGPAGRPGMLRIVNGSAAGGTVTIRPHDAQGRALGPVRLRLGPGEAANLDAWDLELGNPAKGLSGGAGPAPGDWRIEVESGLDLRVLPLVRTPVGEVDARLGGIPD